MKNKFFKKFKKFNKLNITYIIVGGAILAMSVTNCGMGVGGRYNKPFYGGDYCHNQNNNRGRGGVGANQNYNRGFNTGYETQMHRYNCNNRGGFSGGSWSGTVLTTLSPSGSETIRITNKDVFNNFLELVGVCKNTRWSGLHAQFIFGSNSCKSAVNNLRMGLNFFLDYDPQQDSYAEADLYVWHKNLYNLENLQPFVLQGGRFTNVNQSKGFEIIYDLYGERTISLKIRTESKTVEDMEDCQNSRVSIAFANQNMANGSLFSSDCSR